jgi:hypothetical protein
MLLTLSASTDVDPATHGRPQIALTSPPGETMVIRLIALDSVNRDWNVSAKIPVHSMPVQGRISA